MNEIHEANRKWFAWVLAALVVLTSVVVSYADQDQEFNELARRRYPPEVTIRLLRGRIPAPEGFDRCVIESIGQERLNTLRSGADIVSGRENDIAALCLLRLGVPPDTLRPPTSREEPVEQATVQFIDSTYLVASGKTTGFFKTGQDADIMLSGIDFNNTGGPLLFNHQADIATDGAHLLLADTNNNRVLVWNDLPGGNVSPDLVLGQKDFITNNPGTGRDQMNWPVSVSTDGQHIVVADTENHRILIWNSFPTENGTPADLVIQGGDPWRPGGGVSKRRFFWPWGVWTNGEKLAVTSTLGGGVLIWNRFPTQDNQPADILLTAGGQMVTPRNIASDGQSLIVGDHARVGGDVAGNFFWKTFPTTDDQPYDFYMPEPTGQGPWLVGDFTEDGKLILLGSTVHIWNAFPEDANDRPDLSISMGAYHFQGGDHAGLVVAGDKLYISTGNGNSVLVYNSIPTRADQTPDFAIGSPDIYTNTLETNFIITNPVPASSGKSLFVTSDFDRKMYVWKQLPDESGAHPDIVYNLGFAPWDNALWEDTLALAGKRTVYVWEQLPLSGELPDRVFNNRIGSVHFQELNGVAIDGRYLYLADTDANKVYVWEGMPSENSEPAFTLEVKRPFRLSSDGNYLAIVQRPRHTVLVYPVDKLTSGAEPMSVGGPGTFNLPEGALVADGHLFVADNCFHRVHVWRNIKDALSGLQADVVLGEENLDDKTPEIGRDKLFRPATLSFDGSYLWVGEFKFSGRLLRFSPTPTGVSGDAFSY